MAQIKKLAPEVIQKIAAGEMVDRPGNIVKELVENALDAGADFISISIMDGGKTSIIVEDNGYGMNREDAVFCFEHHATSKLTHFDDLEMVNTYGFRGEALSSICSVSDVILITKTKDEKEKTKVHIKNHAVQEISSCVGPVGTTIEITNLFSAIPARKKFLKTESTENGHIMQLFYAHCFQSLSVHFNLIKDEKTVFSCSPVSTILDRYTQLEGFLQAEKMKIIAATTKNDITISGIISNTMFYSYDRSDIFIFVNKRWIKNIGLSRALINGYKNVLPPGKFPRAVLYIALDPHQVDINVSPKKDEVRFLHPKIVEQFIEETITKTLKEMFTPEIKQEHAFFNHNFLTKNIIHEIRPLNTFLGAPTAPTFLEVRTAPALRAPENSENIEQQIIEKNVLKNEFNQESVIQQKIEITDLICLGQFFNTYILAHDHEKLYIIDQHAAHERIMFEKLVKNNNELLAIHLTFPLLITFKKEEIERITSVAHLFSECGILIEKFDETHVVINATPAGISQHHIEKILQEFVVFLKEHSTLEKQEIHDKILYQLRSMISCKSAIKAGDFLEKIACINYFPIYPWYQTVFVALTAVQHCGKLRLQIWRKNLREVRYFFIFIIESIVHRKKHKKNKVALFYRYVIISVVHFC